MKTHAANDATWSVNKDVHEPARSPFWYACYRDSNGRRVRRSTKTTDKTLAGEIAMKWAQLAQAGRAGRLTEAQCRNVIAEMYERTIGEPLHFRSARDYLLEWLENSKADTVLRTYRRYQQIIDTFLAHLGVKADRLLREITPADVRSWRDALKAKGLSAPTVNLALKTLRMPFAAAHNLGYIDINPNSKNSVRLVRDEARNVVKDTFTPSQISELLKAAPSEDWRGAIICGYYTGLRLRDVTELRWNAVDIAEGTIAVTTRKTRKDVTVPMHPQFAGWLKKQIRGIGKAPVFPSLAGKNGSGRSGLSMQFRRIMDKANIKGRLLRENTGAGRSHSSLSFHSLRHSFNSALQAAGVGIETRTQLTGHASVAMNAVYSHESIEVKRRAIALLPNIPTKARAR
jgi:integrase